MVVCDNKKCIFIHIPKTAGTSVEQFLRDNETNDLRFHGYRDGRSTHHFPALRLKKELTPSLFNSYYRFSIVRNPYDRLLSEYYWTPIPNVGYKKGGDKSTFLKYVLYVVKNKYYFTNRYNDHFIPQYLFVYDEKKKLLVNQLFRYEDLDWVKEFLKKKLNIKNDMRHLNATKTGPMEKVAWTDEEKEIIYAIYKNDFILFNYPK